MVVVGARGGAGTSTVAAALGRAAVRSGRRVALVDLDRWGGGLDVLLGIEHLPGLRWGQLAGARGSIRVSDLLPVLPTWRGAWVLSADRSGARPPGPAVVHEVVGALASGCDLVVLDVPRHLAGSDPTAVRHGPEQVQEAAVPPAPRADDPRAPAADVLPVHDAVVLLVPRDVRAVAAASALHTSLAAGGSPVLVVACRPAPGRLTPDDVGAALGRPVAVSMGWESGAAAGAERGAGPLGRPRGAVVRAGEALWTALCRVLEDGPRLRGVPTGTAPTDGTSRGTGPWAPVRAGTRG